MPKLRRCASRSTTCFKLRVAILSGTPAARSTSTASLAREFRAAWTSTRIMVSIRELLGPQARVERVHFRAPQPGHGAQALHANAPEPIAPGHETNATAIVALVDFAATNGATRVIPGSHKLPRLAVPANPDIPFPGERIVTCAAGDALVFNASLRRGGTRNRSTTRRDSLQITFSR